MQIIVPPNGKARVHSRLRSDEMDSSNMLLRLVIEMPGQTYGRGYQGWTAGGSAASAVAGTGDGALRRSGGTKSRPLASRQHCSHVW